MVFHFSAGVWLKYPGAFEETGERIHHYGTLLVHEDLGGSQYISAQ
ncbi:hypothetical protein SAMN05216387_11336 [Nitrosovibrio tenuis]|uniref:Uncharacterized protein n=1 Tax=Nitrosovibrio tenuis TaxID=1233 RepID=A0A1H7QSQ1_9PROT|nr:hypothetical protein SAMN05216387_11336 [Nitrosovibrio tenuis]